MLKVEGTKIRHYWAFAEFKLLAGVQGLANPIQQDALLQPQPEASSDLGH